MAQFPAYTPANTPAKGECQHNVLSLSLTDDPFAIDGQSLIPQPAKPKTSTRPTFVRRASHDLFECIEQSKHKRFDESDAKYVFSQVVGVIEYLDSLGISHCDIKDENIVIDNNASHDDNLELRIDAGKKPPQQKASRKGEQVDMLSRCLVDQR